MTLRLLTGFSLVALGCQTEFDPALLTRGSGASVDASCSADPPCGDVSCCTSLEVPAGAFARSYDESASPVQPGSSDVVTGFQAEGAAPASISGFKLDAFEVTTRRFQRFVQGYTAWQSAGNPGSGAGAHPRISGSGWSASWNGQLPVGEQALVASLTCGPEATYTGASNLPVNCVSWYVAFAFCVWDGGRLPTEAEWNYAAAGGAEQRAFPWSAPASDLTIDAEHAVYGDVAVAVVGSRARYDVGRFGQYDLAGNVREWTLDGGDDLLRYTGSDGCNDCADLSGGSRIRRGGDFGADASRARSAFRSSTLPDATQVWVGVRCAR